jgi:hypothetical protein
MTESLQLPSSQPGVGGVSAGHCEAMACMAVTRCGFWVVHKRHGSLPSGDLFNGSGVIYDDKLLTNLPLQLWLSCCYAYALRTTIQILALTGDCVQLIPGNHVQSSGYIAIISGLDGPRLDANHNNNEQ